MSRPGFVGLAAFWVPVFARKGSRAHMRAGRVYTYCAYVVTLSAVTASAGRIVTCLSQGIGVADRPDLYGFPLFLGGAAPLGLRDRGIAGPLAVLPWILPTVIGIPTIAVWTRRYRRKFNPAPPPADARSA